MHDGYKRHKIGFKGLRYSLFHLLFLQAVELIEEKVADYHCLRCTLEKKKKERVKPFAFLQSKKSSMLLTFKISCKQYFGMSKPPLLPKKEMLVLFLVVFLFTLS